jgi:hypothetical protein
MLNIGLFGTCDKNRWRDPFMSKYDSIGIQYFNPMVDNWHPGMVPLEAQHLAEDEIICFPISRLVICRRKSFRIGIRPSKSHAAKYQ